MKDADHDGSGNPYNIECIPYRTPACDKHLPDNDSDSCPWCEIEQLESALVRIRDHDINANGIPESAKYTQSCMFHTFRKWATTALKQD